MEELAQVFKALGEPIRLRILHLLMQRESLCVCDLVSVLNLGQSTVSRHLSYLKNSGLVSSYRQGTWMHYRLVSQALTIMNMTELQAKFGDQVQCQSDLQALETYESLPRTCSV